MRHFGCINAARGTHGMKANPPVAEWTLPSPGTCSYIESFYMPVPGKRIKSVRWRRVPSPPMDGEWALDNFGGVWVPELSK